MQKTIHFALFLFIVTGMLFTGCGTPTVTTDDTQSSLEESLEVDGGEEGTTGADAELEDTVETEVDDEETSTDESAYVDGSYSVTQGYNSPGGKDGVGITLVLKDGVVSSVSVSNGGSNETSKMFQDTFADGISAAVVGKRIDELGSISAVNGASLTTGAFKNAVEEIMSEAQGA